MRRVTTLLPIALLCVSIAAPAPAVELKTEDEKTVYAMGAVISQRLKTLALSPAEIELAAAGFRDQLLGNEMKVNVDDYQAKFAPFAQGRVAVAAEAEKKRSAEYLAKAAAEKGARKLDSGLIFKDTDAGSGPSPAATDKVTVHYTGTLTDGTKFDSSVDRGEPATFPLNGVIPCWTEGVQLMKKGGKARLICPSDIAYGDQGRPPKIPGGATLVFDIELISIGDGDQ